jgi:hypothetical protein
VRDLARISRQRSLVEQRRGGADDDGHAASRDSLTRQSRVSHR